MATIASLAAVGLGPGLGGSSGRTGAPIEEEATPQPEETVTGVQTFQAPLRTIDPSQPHKAIVKTNKGEIEIQLVTDAPEAVNSFAFLAGSGFYNGTVFFYLNPEFVAQAGDPTCDAGGKNICTGVGGPGYSLDVEPTAEGHEQWAVVAPAVIPGQEVHGSQFRILFQPAPEQDGEETVFGKVVRGQEILQSAGSFVPCTVAEAKGCAAQPDMASALVIEEVTVLPA